MEGVTKNERKVNNEKRSGHEPKEKVRRWESRDGKRRKKIARKKVGRKIRIKLRGKSRYKEEAGER